MSDLPEDLIRREILLRLPAESLFRLRAVCKGWRTVIDDPSFVKAHQLSSLSSHTLVIIKDSYSNAHPHRFDLDALNLSTDGDQAIISGSSLDLTSLLWLSPVSVCNCLMLVYPINLSCPFEIWNLSTHERLRLPPIDFIDYASPLMTGLGYDHLAQDYKALVMHSQQTHVYSLRSDTWTTTTGGHNLYAEDYQGVFACGALHWLLKDNKILALDIGTEKHRHIHLNNNALQKTLDVLGGCLAMSGDSDDFQFFDVWVMKDYGSDDESWTKLLSINKVDLVYARPVAYMNSDKNQVFMRDVVSGFFLFDVKSGSMKRVHIHRLNGILEALIIPQTIFRLRDHCGGGTSRIERLCPSRKVIKDVSLF